MPRLLADGVVTKQEQSANFWDCSDPYISVQVLAFHTDGGGRESEREIVRDSSQPTLGLLSMYSRPGTLCREIRTGDGTCARRWGGGDADSDRDRRERQNEAERGVGSRSIDYCSTAP